jgi:cupin fold WbuC family metalloprotein
MYTKILNSEVLEAKDPIVTVSYADIEFLKISAAQNERKRIRLCTHRGVNNLLHEMLIVHEKGIYVRPHKHLLKSESVHIIEGLVDVIVFDDIGNVSDVISMGDYSSRLKFYYRMPDPYYHTLLIRSDVLVFHEVTNGPFKKEDTIFAPWSPDENNIFALKGFIEKLFIDAKKFKKNLNTSI